MSILGTTIRFKPIIPCNEDGIYYTIAKVIGRKRSLKKAMELAINFDKDSKKYNVIKQRDCNKKLVPLFNHKCFSYISTISTIVKLLFLKSSFRLT